MTPSLVVENIRDDSPQQRSPTDMMGAPLVEMASAELEQARGSGTCDSNHLKRRYHSFPPACLTMLKRIPGNERCMDCGQHDPEWATISYGAMLCLQCSGHHRSLGVQVSCVRSVRMDDWSLPEILAMLEGGNGQLATFFDRHALSEASARKPSSNNNRSKSSSSVITQENVTRLRYKTKAAQFYRQQMELHVDQVMQSGPYRGREMSRRVRPSLDRRNTSME